MDIKKLKFDERGLIPAIAQDAATREVLMMAWMNLEAIEKTVATGRAHYFSRSRRRLWLKGETSGNFQEIAEIFYDCDLDTLLLMVRPLGPACHTGEKTCFHRTLGGKAGVGKKPALTPLVLNGLERILEERKTAPADRSYTASLYSKGVEKMLEKVKEESDELIEAARVKGKKDVIYEATDLLFHVMVLLSHKGIEMEEVYAEISRRFGRSGLEEKASRRPTGR